MPQSDLDDLRERLGRTRRTPRSESGWERGTATPVLDDVLAHWAGPFDWRAVESRWNAFEHVRVEGDGIGIHVVRAGTRGAAPLLLLHGWPDGWWRFEQALPLLADRFELVVPSISGARQATSPDCR